MHINQVRQNLGYDTNIYNYFYYTQQKGMEVYDLSPNKSINIY